MSATTYGCHRCGALFGTMAAFNAHAETPHRGLRYGRSRRGTRAHRAADAPETHARWGERAVCGNWMPTASIVPFDAPPFDACRICERMARQRDSRAGSSSAGPADSRTTTPEEAPDA